MYLLRRCKSDSRGILFFFLRELTVCAHPPQHRLSTCQHRGVAYTAPYRVILRDTSTQLSVWASTCRMLPGLSVNLALMTNWSVGCCSCTGFDLAF